MELALTDIINALQEILPWKISLTESDDNDYPFINHEQFPLILDTLHRKMKHHINIQTNLPHELRCNFISALNAAACSNANLAFGQVCISNTELTKAKMIALEKKLHDLKSHVSKQTLALILPRESLANEFIVTLLSVDFIRIIYFGDKNTDDDNALSPYFQTIHIATDTDEMNMNILKVKKSELEKYHNVSISDEIISLAHKLALRYLSQMDRYQATIILIDASAARAGLDSEHEVTSIVGPSHIYDALSHLTSLSKKVLQQTQFDYNANLQSLQKNIFGQDIALNLICQKLQQSQIVLYEKSQPRGTFLFTGPANTGKKFTATMLAQQLFGEKKFVYHCQIDANDNDILACQFFNAKMSGCFDLATIMEHSPFAILYIENVEHSNSSLLNSLHKITQHGKIYTDKGIIDFSKSILILETVLGAEKIRDLAKSFTSTETTAHSDLLQLVMNEKEEFYSASPTQIIKAITPEFVQQLSKILLPAVCITPFLPLNIFALDKIIKSKFQILTRHLEEKFHFELSYANEVVKFLREEVIASQDANIDYGLQLLEDTIAQAINCAVSMSSKYLYIHLNETGEYLRYDWISTPSVRQHAP